MITCNVKSAIMSTNHLHEACGMAEEGSLPFLLKMSQATQYVHRINFQGWRSQIQRGNRNPILESDWQKINENEGTLMQSRERVGTTSNHQYIYIYVCMHGKLATEEGVYEISYEGKILTSSNMAATDERQVKWE